MSIFLSLTLIALNVAAAGAAPALPGRAISAASPPTASAIADPLPSVLRLPPTVLAAADSASPPVIWAGDEGISVARVQLEERGNWLRAPFGDNLLTDPARWRSESRRPLRANARLDYNRVDGVKFGGSYQVQDPYTMNPRLGGMVEYALGRKRTLYGVQLEQPLVRPGRLALGASMVRRTDHSELQQVDDIENTLALLLGRNDYRDYFEREGFGAYLSWRVPDFSTVSLHGRRDTYRSLTAIPGTRSWFELDRPLRGNPAIDPGTMNSVLLRLERLAETNRRTRSGLYHWIEVQRAGGDLGGDFTFTRVLADVRSVLRLTPATTLAVRAVGGGTPSGVLPAEREFTAGGVDGLRAHSFSQYRGDQMVLGQAEYDVGLWKLRSAPVPGGLHAIAFVDMGRAWSDPDHRWDVNRQHLATDGGFGFATSEDAVRVYFARSLQKPSSGFVISFRLQRPF